VAGIAGDIVGWDILARMEEGQEAVEIWNKLSRQRWNFEADIPLYRGSMGYSISIAVVRIK
jgi:hypothetical protein